MLTTGWIVGFMRCDGAGVARVAVVPRSNEEFVGWLGGHPIISGAMTLLLPQG